MAPTRTVDCARCGAPSVLSLVAREQACVSCGATLVLPIEVRAHLHAAAEVIGSKLALASSLDVATGKVAAAEGGALAFAVGLVLLLCGGLQGLSLVSALNQGLERSWPSPIVPACAGLATAISVALAALVVHRWVKRRVLRTFSAGAPEPGAPHGVCHACGGPLPPANTGSVRCAFCGCDNLLGERVVIRRAVDVQAALGAHAEDMLGAVRKLRLTTQLVGYATLVLMPLLSVAVWVFCTWLLG